MDDFKRRLKIPLYGGTLIVIIVDDLASINKKYPELKDMDLNVHGGVTFWEGTNIYCAFDRNITPGIIAHEAKHAVNRKFIQIDHYLERGNDEPECYLLAWMVNRIHESKDRWTKLRKEKQ